MHFAEVLPTLDNYWRSIILFGRNVASYKFALGKSLLELSSKGSETVSLDELAEPFARHVCICPDSVPFFPVGILLPEVDEYARSSFRFAGRSSGGMLKE